MLLNTIMVLLLCDRVDQYLVCQHTVMMIIMA